MSFTEDYLKEVQSITAQLPAETIERAVTQLRAVRDRGGRLFILGVGGSAANASHAVNDFRKICGFECYAPTDNVSELTARANDEGWPTIFAEWLKGSRLNSKDGLLIFSVGGGNLEKNVSPNLVVALQLAKQIGATIVGIVGRDGGHTAQVADACVIVPTVNADHVTPHSEACLQLKQAGFLLVVATNQPDVGRGTLAQSAVEAIHESMCRALPIDRVEVCYDPGGAPSECRKPRPGMLLKAAREMDIDLTASYMVGDRWKDIDCGHAAGCRTIFIDNGYSEELRQPPDYRVTSLLEAAQIICCRT